jgi:hypothetical protein
MSQRDAVRVEGVGRLLVGPGRPATDSSERWTRRTRESSSTAATLNPTLGSVKVSRPTESSVGASVTGTRPLAAARSQSQSSRAFHVVRQESSNFQNSPAAVRTLPWTSSQFA